MWDARYPGRIPSRTGFEPVVGIPGVKTRSAALRGDPPCGYPGTLYSFPGQQSRRDHFRHGRWDALPVPVVVPLVPRCMHMLPVFGYGHPARGPPLWGPSDIPCPMSCDSGPYPCQQGHAGLRLLGTYQLRLCPGIS
eukprot:1468516-Rhodomonas_salina.1